MISAEQERIIVKTKRLSCSLFSVPIQTNQTETTNGAVNEYSKVKILLGKYKIYVYLFFPAPKAYPTETPILL